MIVNGTNSGDIIDVVGAGTSASVVGLSAVVNITASEGANDALVVNGGGGNDSISAATLPAGVTNLTLDGGAGDDILLGSAGADRLLGGDGNDFVDGNRGDDTAFLGAGDDVFQWDPGDGNDIIEGQDGVDRLDFNGANIAENIDISANGGRVRFTRDVANITMDLNDVELVRFKALGGADNIVINDLSGTDVVHGWRPCRSCRQRGRRRRRGRPRHGQRHGRQRRHHCLSEQRASSASPACPAAVTIFNAESGDQLIVNGGAGNDTINASMPCPSAPSRSRSTAAPATTCSFGGQGSETLLGGVRQRCAQRRHRRSTS